MGSQLCTVIPGVQLRKTQPSDIYLSNPSNIAKKSLRISQKDQLVDPIGIYIGTDNNLILGCKEDQKRLLLNKYILTYMYFLRPKSADSQVQINDFCQLLKVLDTDKKFTNQIELFQKEYLNKSTPKQKAQFLISQYFKNGFYSAAIQKFPFYSSDPSILGHARRPIVDMCKGIKAKYDKGIKNNKKTIYCVIQLPKSEEKLIQKMSKARDYFTFSTFVRCFSDEGKAKKRQKQLHKLEESIRQSHKLETSTILFTITIKKQEVDPDSEYGFYIDEFQKDNPMGDIILNIMNFFQVTGGQSQNKNYDLKFNALPRLIFQRRERMLSRQHQLLKVWDLLSGQCYEIKSHSQLLRMVADRKLSITASQSLKKSLKETNEDNERINLIQAYLEQRDYEKAMDECKDKTTAQFMVRKAQILYESNKQDEAYTILQELQQNKNMLKKQNFKEYVLFEFIFAKIRHKRGEENLAKKHMQTVSNAMKKEYKGGYEYRGRQVEKYIQELSKSKEDKIEHSEPVNWEKYADGLNVGVLLSR